MRVQSIGTAIKVRDVTCDCLFNASREVTLREVHGVAELHHLSKEIGTVAEAFEDSGHLLASGVRAPLVIDGRNFAGRICVLDETYFAQDLLLCEFRHYFVFTWATAVAGRFEL